MRGIVPEQSVEKLRRCAEIALEEFDGELGPILRRPLAQAEKALKRFPAIGDPGAEKILLFGRRVPDPGAGIERSAGTRSPGIRNGDIELLSHLSLRPGSRRK